MFDSVSRKDFEVERELRIKAEAEASALRGQVAYLQKLLERQAEQQTDLLDRLQPKPEKVPPFVGNALSRLSAKEIRQMPAVGKRGIRERNSWALEAEQREQQEESAETREKRREGLTDAELAEVDKAIGENGVGV